MNHFPRRARVSSLRPLQRLVSAAALLAASFSTAAQDIAGSDPGALLRVAERVASEARINMIGAKGAVQVSQVADQAQLELSIIIIKQNEEVIRLLRSMAKERR